MHCVTNNSQLESNRRRVAEVYYKVPKNITRECVEIGAAFIYLKVEKLSRIPRPVPDKTLITIELKRLHKANSMFYGVDLALGESAVISSNKLQEFDGGYKEGGLGLVLRVKFKSSS